MLGRWVLEGDRIGKLETQRHRCQCNDVNPPNVLRVSSSEKKTLSLWGERPQGAIIGGSTRLHSAKNQGISNVNGTYTFAAQKKKKMTCTNRG